jgi:AraC family transcriptional activator of mtrCDE
MNAALRLLSTGGLSVAEIAERVGYDSDVAFGRAFRRHVGMAPSAWRRSIELGDGALGDGLSGNGGKKRDQSGRRFR